MKIHIKNMNCKCSRTVVKSEMEKVGIYNISMDTNEVEIDDNTTNEQILILQQALLPYGLEFIHDNRDKLIEKIKIIITTHINSSEEELKINLSDHICTKVNYTYNYLNKIFKISTGTTIEQYTISKKIERVKELLSNEDKSLSEIAHMMQYSSLAHLSNQFKKVTGIQPSSFKQYKSKGLGY